MGHQTVRRAAPPALPNAPAEYKKVSFDQHNNVLRLYFNMLDNVLRELIVDTSGISVKAYLEKSANYTIEASNDFLIHYTSGSYTVSLPTAVGITGQEFEVKNSGIGTITLDADGSETIDGALTKSLAQYDAVKVMSTGTNWIIV